MPRRSSTLADQLAVRLRSLDATRRCVDSLRSRKEMSQRAADRMYEALFLSAVTSFESFLEDLFLGLLVSGAGFRSTGVRPRMTIHSPVVARQLVIGPGRTYADWLPYDKTRKRAEVFFRGGRPFTELTNPHVQVLERTGAIRNAIAHKSQHSVAQFSRKVLATTPIPQRERSPAGFLQGLMIGTPPLTRFENYMADLIAAARVVAR